ncbi:hypothetical protein Gotur_020798 [Gossypium turneri]
MDKLTPTRQFGIFFGGYQ